MSDWSHFTSRTRTPLLICALVLILIVGVTLPEPGPHFVGPITAAGLLIPSEPLAYSIKEFCRAHGISPPTYYELKKQNLAPAEMRMGTVIRISREAAADWRKARENPVASEAEATARTADVLRDRARRAAKRAIESPKHVSRRSSA